jgi:hypothetical protein
VRGRAAITIALGLTLFAALHTACGTPPATVADAPREPDIRTILPDGATLIVVARPRELFDAPPSAAVIRGVVPDAQLESIRVMHGIDARTLEHAALASYESGEAAGDVLVLQGPFRSEVAVAEIAHRMLPRESSTDAPPARAGGVLHGTRMDAIAIAPHTLVLVIGPPALTARVMRTVAGTAPPAIAGAVQQAMSRHTEPFVAIRPVPLALPGTSPVAVLLAEEESILIAAAPVAPDAIHVAVDLAGQFPPGADANFRQLVISVAQTTMGTALGLRSALGTLHAEASPTSVTLRADFSAAELARGLALLFRAEIADALSEVGTDDQPTPPPDTVN